jgi:terminal uridylyltransferase
MEQKNDPPSSGLENQLRGMILGNVRITDGQPNQEAQRGRGRGRGGIWRGNRNPPNRPEQSQEQQTNSSSSPTFSGRGGGNDFRGRGYRQRGNPIVQHAHQGPGPVHHGPTLNAGRQHAPTHPRQPHHGGSSSPTVQHAPGANPPRVLQRPYNATQAPPRHQQQPRENPAVQVEYLESLAAQEIPKVEMSLAEFEEKEAFRQQLESIFQQAFQRYRQHLFGWLWQSGFRVRYARIGYGPRSRARMEGSFSSRPD